VSSPRPSHDVEVDERAGYWALIVGNRNFRRLWVGNVISLLGDWFNTLALYVLVTELTGSPLALGAVFITKMLPWALSAPLAGVIVDRYNRRRLMVGMNLVRAVVVLGFLLIDQPADVPWLYALLTGQVVAGAVFNPAKSAALPNITTPRELLTANVLMSATWSTMLAVGAALGGEPSRRWAPMPPSGSTAGRTSSRPSSSWEPPFRRTLIRRTRRFSGPLSAKS